MSQPRCVDPGVLTILDQVSPVLFLVGSRVVDRLAYASLMKLGCGDLFVFKLESYSCVFRNLNCSHAANVGVIHCKTHVPCRLLP